MWSWSKGRGPAQTGAREPDTTKRINYTAKRLQTVNPVIENWANMEEKRHEELRELNAQEKRAEIARLVSMGTPVPENYSENYELARLAERRPLRQRTGSMFPNLVNKKINTERALLSHTGAIAGTSDGAHIIAQVQADLVNAIKYKNKLATYRFSHPGFEEKEYNKVVKYVAELQKRYYQLMYKGPPRLNTNITTLKPTVLIGGRRRRTRRLRNSRLRKSRRSTKSS
jgi:hypothetical protein